MSTILDQSWVKTAENREALKWVFDQLGLPIPRHDPTNPRESDFADGSAKMVFLNPMGCVMRIYDENAHKPQPLIRHKHLLRPAISFKANDFRVDLQPGIKIFTSGSDAYHAFTAMYNDGINVHDLLRLEKDKLDEEIEKGILETKPNALGGSNSSYLPCSDNTVSMIERTVCFDPDSIDILTDKIKPVSRLLHARIYDLSPEMPEEADLQDKIYGHIRNAFAKACIPGQENLDSQAVREAWLLCLQETQNANGVLDAAWKRQEPNGYADRTSRCYEDLLGSACTWMQQP